MKKKSSFSFKGKMGKVIENRKKGTGFGYMNLPEGVTVYVPEADTKVDFDFIPYIISAKNHPDKVLNHIEAAEKGEPWWRLPFLLHRNIGSKNEAFVCPTTFGKKCPICEYQAKLKKEGGDEEEIKSLKTSVRILFNVIIKGNKKIDPHTIYLYDVSDFLFMEKFEEQLGDDEKWETFPDLTDGATVRVRFVEETYAKNKYAAPTRFDFVDRKEQYDEDLINEAPVLEDCLKVLSYEELKARFFEIEVDEEEEEDETPRSKKQAAKPAKKSVKDEDEDEDEEEEEEDEAPKKPIKKQQSKPASKPVKKAKDEEEDEDEDEEEDEPPVRTRKGKATVKEGCPHDYVFGKDTDKHDECEECELWNECYEKKKSNKR